MNPIIRIINYLFKKRNINFQVESIESIFEDGIGFAKVVAMAFDVDEIENISKYATDLSQIQQNNEIALQYVMEHNSYISKNHPSFETERDQIILLGQILKRQCFKICYHKLLNTCKLILSQLGIEYNKKKDIISTKCILELLNVLTDEKVKIESEPEDFDTFMQEKFAQANVPLFIDQTSFQKANRFVFFIQIQVIFDIFSEKIKLISEQTIISEEEPTKIVDEEINLDFFDSDDKDEDEDEDDFSADENETKMQDFLDMVKSIKNNKQPKTDKEIDKLNNDIFFKVLKIIGKHKQIVLNSFEDVLVGNNAPNLIYAIVKDKKILSLNRELKLPRQRMNDIVIYLGTKDSNELLFNTTKIDFSKTKYELRSAYLLFTNILNVYFVKDSRRKMLQRMTTIIFTNITRKDFFYEKYILNIKNHKNPYDDESILLQWESYLALMNFMNEGDTHFKNKTTKSERSYFKKYNIPQIINRSYLSNFVEKVPDAAYYQLQFIYNIMNIKLPFIIRLQELLLTALRAFKSIKIPSIKEFAAILKARSLSLQKSSLKKDESQIEKNEENLKKFLETMKAHDEEEEDLEKPETYEKRFQRFTETVKQSRINKLSSRNKGAFYLKKPTLNLSSQEKYKVKNSLLYKEESFHNSESEWKHALDMNEEYSSSSSDSDTLFSIVKTQNVKSKLFKFFQYNSK